MPPPSPNFRIKTLTAYIAVDPKDNSEGVIAIGGLPAIGADEERLLSLRPAAEVLAKEAGLEVKVVRFCVREDLETLSVS